MRIHLLLLALLICVPAPWLCAQNRCLTPDEASKVVASVTAPFATVDAKAVRKELVGMQKEHAKLNAVILEDFAKNQGRISELNKLSEANLVRVCGIFKKYGWPPKDALKDEGFAALQYLVIHGKAFDMQHELLPVLIAASKKGDIPKPIVADLVDTIRIGGGVPQIFGTQAARRGDVLYIQPLLDYEKVNEWRKAYDLPPLADEIRGLEKFYSLPVLYTPTIIGRTVAWRNNTGDNSALGISDPDAEIKVETKIVNLNVRVFTSDLKTPFGVSLTKDDLIVTEDGVEQQTQFFSTESAPFDLVLLLDFSGSTADKRSLIKKAAKRFVEVARPEDRVSVIAFADEIKTVSELTADKPALYAAIDKIKTEGGSPIWDSLRFAYDKVVAKKAPGRRSAVVFMTDAYDNSSKSTFADAMETVRHSDATVFSVYVNSFDVKPSQKDWFGRLVTKLQASLSMLSDETGGQFYRANDLKDLNGIYEQVVNDIGRIYSVGYEPTNDRRDGGWRSVVLKLRKHPDLVAKTRRGYYAN